MLNAGDELQDEHRQLIELICERFQPELNHADLGLLFEVTGYQGEAQDEEFWDDFDDSQEIPSLLLKNLN